jgi:hypothetical protein
MVLKFNFARLDTCFFISLKVNIQGFTIALTLLLSIFFLPVAEIKRRIKYYSGSFGNSAQTHVFSFPLKFIFRVSP